MMQWRIGAAVIALAMSSAACGQARSENGGAVVSRNYAVGGFERIEVAGPYDVQVRTGGAPSVSASGPSKHIERLVVEVRGDSLLIHPRKDGTNWTAGWKRGEKVRLDVTVPQLRGVEMAGSGDMRIDSIRGDRFEGEIAGSGQLSVESLDVQDLKLGVAGSGTATARSGRARKVEYDIAGSGDIRAGGIASQTASVSIAGSGNVAAQARTTADVSIVGSGDVQLTGGARCTVSKLGSGNVRCS